MVVKDVMIVSVAVAALGFLVVVVMMQVVEMTMMFVVVMRP
jgi:hypothetical protein